MEMGHVLARSGNRLVEVSLMVSPGLFRLLVCMNRIILLSQVSILPLFPEHAIFSTKNFRLSGFFTFSFFKDSDVLLLLKGKNNISCFLSSVLPEACDFCFVYWSV
jgi:hypothetical protein